MALLLKEKTPRWPVLLVAATNFCVNPELFVIPTPEISKVKLGLVVIVKALALALKTIPLTSVIAEREIAVFECRGVGGAVRYSSGCPVSRSIPVSAAGVRVPCGATSIKALGW